MDDEVPSLTGMYPEYFMNNLHFHSDGWLTSRSGSAPDFTTETLFFGHQDAMHRQVLVPLKFWMDGQLAKAANQSNMKMLEIASGDSTGRFMTFFRDNYPSIDATLLGSSDVGLEEAGENDSYFRKFFKENDKRGKKFEPLPLTLVEGNAEKLDRFED